jgi:hypothetical protein
VRRVTGGDSEGRHEHPGIHAHLLVAAAWPEMVGGSGATSADGLQRWRRLCDEVDDFRWRSRGGTSTSVTTHTWGKLNRGRRRTVDSGPRAPAAQLWPCRRRWLWPVLQAVGGGAETSRELGAPVGLLGSAGDDPRRPNHMRRRRFTGHGRAMACSGDLEFGRACARGGV